MPSPGFFSIGVRAENPLPEADRIAWGGERFRRFQGFWCLALERPSGRLDHSPAARAGKERKGTMKSIHDLIGMPVVTVEEGTHLGTLQGVEVDTAEGRIRYLQFDGADSRADGVLSWDAVHAVGADAITIDSLASVQDSVPAPDRDQVTPLIGDRPVVTEGGAHLGNVTAYDVDEKTGRIELYHVATGGIFGRLVRSELTFTHDAIRALGQDAIIVANEVSPSLAETSK